MSCSGGVSLHVTTRCTFAVRRNAIFASCLWIRCWREKFGVKDGAGDTQLRKRKFNRGVLPTLPYFRELEVGDITKLYTYPVTAIVDHWCYLRDQDREPAISGGYPSISEGCCEIFFKNKLNINRFSRKRHT